MFFVCGICEQLGGLVKIKTDMPIEPVNIFPDL